jgi:hypothetical protein
VVRASPLVRKLESLIPAGRIAVISHLDPSPSKSVQPSAPRVRARTTSLADTLVVRPATEYEGNEEKPGQGSGAPGEPIRFYLRSSRRGSQTMTRLELAVALATQDILRDVHATNHAALV